MNAPTVKSLRRWTREPYFAVDQSWLKDAFSRDRAGEALARWQAAAAKLDPGLNMGSRQGLVLFWEACRLRFQMEDFDPALYAAITASVWVEGKREHACREFGLCEPEELLEVIAPFALSPVIMSDDEIAAHTALPEVITIFRGGTGPDDVLAQGTSWTIDRAQAVWFAENRPSGMLIKRNIPKSEIVAFFPDRGEGEVVIRPSSDFASAS